MTKIKGPGPGSGTASGRPKQRTFCLGLYLISTHRRRSGRIQPRWPAANQPSPQNRVDREQGRRAPPERADEDDGQQGAPPANGPHPGLDDQRKPRASLARDTNLTCSIRPGIEPATIEPNAVLDAVILHRLRRERPENDTHHREPFKPARSYYSPRPRRSGPSASGRSP